MDATLPDVNRSAIILFAHGSTVAPANAAVERIAEQLSRRAQCVAISAFLEKARPDLAEAIAQAVGGGANRVIIIPYFLTMGAHISRDLPELARRQRERFPGLQVRIAAPMEGHPLLLDVLLERMSAALRDGESPSH